MGMRKLLLQALLLAAPFVVIMAVVVVVDPYNKFRFSPFIPAELKEKNLWHEGKTMTFSNLVWKLIAYKQQPSENVLFGDSRLAHFDDAHLREVSGTAYYNFGIPGGNYASLEALFGYADSLATLKHVVVQTSFRSMNTGGDHDLYAEAALIADDPLLHVTNRRVLKATWLNVYSKYFPERVVYDQLAPDHWQLVLGIDSTNASTFRLDTTKFEVLRRIARRCTEEGATLRFVEYPTHPDVQAIYQRAGLGPVRQEYIRTLERIAPTTDLDAPGVFPTGNGYWRDPLHLTMDAQRVVIDTVWAAR